MDGAVGLAAGAGVLFQVDQAEGALVGVGHDGLLAQPVDGNGVGRKGQGHGLFEGQRVGIQHHQGAGCYAGGRGTAEGGIQDAAVFGHLVETIHQDGLASLGIVPFPLGHRPLRAGQGKAIVVTVAGPFGIVAFQPFAARVGFETQWPGGPAAGTVGGVVCQGSGLAGGADQGAAGKGHGNSQANARNAWVHGGNFLGNGRTGSVPGGVYRDRPCRNGKEANDSERDYYALFKRKTSRF